MVYILKYLLCSLLPASFSISCCAALFFPGILTPSGKFLSRSRIRIFLCFMISTAFAVVVKYFYQNFGTWVLHPCPVGDSPFYRYIKKETFGIFDLYLDHDDL